jgi:uncharacterized membrane-anchored protein
MRRTLVVVVILCQVCVLAFMAGKREFIVRAGRTVFLRTAPLDPRDLFRGDYVRLRYEISSVPFDRASPEIVEQYKKSRTGKTVYASLKEEGGLAEIVSLSLEKPAGLFIKGSVASPGGAWFSSGGIPVKYGIETYFVQQGKGLEMEKKLGSRSTVQVPLEMEVALAGDGAAVVKNHRWSPLGIGIEMIRTQQTGTVRQRGPEPGRKSARFRITFKNVSDKPMAFVNMPGYCSLTLEPVASGQQEGGATIPDRPVCAGLKPSAADVFVFQPDGSGTVDIDLAETEWQVLSKGTLVEPGELPGNERFRIVYHPPDAAACSHLENANIVWHGRIATAAFNGRGNVD